MEEAMNAMEESEFSNRNRCDKFTGVLCIGNTIETRPCLFGRPGFDGKLPIRSIKVIGEEVGFIVHHERR